MTAPVEFGSAFVNHYLFYDTESTGNKPTEDDIISLGCVLCTYNGRQFVPIDEFHSYVDTDRKIDPAAQAVHHISKQMLQGQPRFPEMMKVLRTFLMQHQTDPNTRLIFIAHNGSKFDDIILYCNFVQHNLNFDLFLRDVHCYGFLDTLKYLRVLFKDCQYKDKPKDANTGRESFALGHCFTSFCGGSSLEGAHDALVDAQALLNIFNSECVAPKINLSGLFKNVVPKLKGVKWVKQTAGIAFQTKEENAMKEACPERQEASDAQRPTELRNLPIFDAAEDPHHQLPLRLCLNCMSFVRLTEHRVCKIEGAKALETDEPDAVVPDDLIHDDDEAAMDSEPEDRDFDF